MYKINKTFFYLDTLLVLEIEMTADLQNCLRQGELYKRKLITNMDYIEVSST